MAVFHLAFELLGAMVGAGFASGREIASFFSSGGRWSWLGIAAAVLMLGTLLLVAQGHKTNRRSVCFEALTKVMLLVTGGAMLSCCGDMAALLVPVGNARIMGVFMSLAAAWYLAQRTDKGLTLLSRCMAVLLLAMMAWGLAEPREAVVHLHPAGLAETILRGAAWGGFNAALIVPVLRARPVERGCGMRAVLLLCGMALGLLVAGNAVLLRHPARMQDAAPFAAMANRWGSAGYALSASGLLLAALSTLTACIRGLKGRPCALAGLLIISAAGFTHLVDTAYPWLGAAGIVLIILEAAAGGRAATSVD